jgi:hypothetical protein
VSEAIPAHIQRFILTSIDSVPHLEAILLLRNSPVPCTAAGVARTLYISETRAGEILAELCNAGFALRGEGDAYRYEPVSPELRGTLDELSEIYPRQIVRVSQLIHAKIDKQAQTFGDAFKWKKE